MATESKLEEYGEIVETNNPSADNTDGWVKFETNFDIESNIFNAGDVTLEKKSTVPIPNEEDSDEEKYEDNNKIDTEQPYILKKQLTLYSSLQEVGESLPLPYENNCKSRISYYFQTFLVTHPRLYALYLLYSSTWPRGLVLLDMYTDFRVTYSLWDRNQIIWFMLSCMFIVMPFILVWTVSLRFIQKFVNNLYSKDKSNTNCMRMIINFGLTLYIFPPIGALCVALYEVYLVIYDICNGIKCFILGTGLVEAQTNQAVAIKQYRRAVEIFSESVPQTLLQLYMYFRKVNVDQRDLYLSLAISAFNLVINFYRFRKEAKIVKCLYIYL